MTTAVSKNGRRAPIPHKVTDDLMKQCTALAAVGCTQAQISLLFRIDEDTFRKHYGEEYNRAKVMAIGKVAETLFKRATEKQDLGAAIFYLKAQAGWRETPSPLEGLASGLNIHIHL